MLILTGLISVFSVLPLFVPPILESIQPDLFILSFNKSYYLHKFGMLEQFDNKLQFMKHFNVLVLDNKAKWLELNLLSYNNNKNNSQSL